MTVQALQRLFYALLCFQHSFIALGAQEKNTSKDWLITLPIIAMGRESMVAVDKNLMGEASLAVQWSFLGKGEELRDHELKERPNESLETQGQELAMMFQRFSNSYELSGFHWGLGAGYRRLTGLWKKSPYQNAGDASPPSVLTDAWGKVHHRLGIEGTTVSGRVGYRYVAESLGFAAGIYLKLRHFQSHVRDQEGKDKLADQFESDIVHHDKIALKRRLMSTLLPGIEIGWAF